MNVNIVNSSGDVLVEMQVDSKVNGRYLGRALNATLPPEIADTLRSYASAIENQVLAQTDAYEDLIRTFRLVLIDPEESSRLRVEDLQIYSDGGVSVDVVS